MKNKQKLPTQFFLIMIFLFVCSGAFAQQRPSFNKNADILIAAYDIKPDPDDIHAVAALGSMLVHPDLDGVNYFAVAGAYGNQGGNYLQSNSLFNMAFGNNWTDADANRSAAVNAVKARVLPILQNGGKVFVQEAGQSDVTYLWLKDIIDANNGVNANTARNNVVVVQHSDTFNEGNTTQSWLTYVKNNTNYFLLDDGNAPPTAAWGDHGPWSTPAYRDPSSQFVDNAKNSPNTKAKQLWTEADRLFNSYYPNGFPFNWSFFFTDGVDYSDIVEDWWIFEIGANADTHQKFWTRYVMNTDSNNGGGNTGGGTPAVDCNSIASSFVTGTTITVAVDYTADQNRDVVIELWNATTNQWLNQNKTSVTAGSGTANVTLNFNTAPVAGNNYLIKASIRPVGGGWQTSLDVCNKTNVTLTTTGGGNTGGGTPDVDCNSLPSSLVTGTAIAVAIDYTADQNRDVVIELWNATTNQWLNQNKTTVTAGSGTANVTLNFNTAPVAGNNYLLKSSIRPVGGGWQTALDACNKTNITLTTTGGGNTGGGTPDVDCNSLPSSLVTGNAIAVAVNYTADQNRDVVIELWNGATNQWLKQNKTTVTAGSGTANVTLNFNTAPAAGNNYLLKASIRPVGGGWQTSLDACNKGNISLTNGAARTANNTLELITYPNPIKKGDELNINLTKFDKKNNRSVTVTIYNFKGRIVQEEELKFNENLKFRISPKLNNSIYLMKVSTGGEEITKRIMIQR